MDAGRAVETVGIVDRRVLEAQRGRKRTRENIEVLNLQVDREDRRDIVADSAAENLKRILLRDAQAGKASPTSKCKGGEHDAGGKDTREVNRGLYVGAASNVIEGGAEALGGPMAQKRKRDDSDEEDLNAKDAKRARTDSEGDAGGRKLVNVALR